MLLNNLHKKQLVIFYFICFALTYLWLIIHGLLLCQLQPVLFLNKLDITRNILMLTDLQHSIIADKSLQLIFDGIYIFLPLALLICCIKNYSIQYFLAVINCIFNFMYAMQITSMSTLSVEGYISWILFPLVFAFRSSEGFYYMIQSMRYFFLLIFVSAALWKIRGGGIFNVEQMAAILVKQHTSYIWSDPLDWFSQLIRFLAIHKIFSWCIYAATTVTELVFIIGFFTKKYDRLLIILFIAFLLGNFFIMRINYISWVIFTGCLWFARYAEPVSRNKKIVFQ